MIKHNLKIFSQNVRKNKALTNTIPETQKNLSDIIFIQEPPRSLLCQLPSHMDPLEDSLCSTSNHPE